MRLNGNIVEEVGTSNIFFVIDDELITPPLTGTILPGITRDSVLQLARDRGYRTAERRISIDEVFQAHRGRLPEGNLRHRNGRSHLSSR